MAKAMIKYNNGLSNGSGTTSFALSVKNLPPELEQEAVRSMFQVYGNVKGIQLFRDNRNNCNRAFISYEKFSEAEAAINDLNEKEPLMLIVQFKDKGIKYQEHAEINLSAPVFDFRYSPSTLENSQGKKAIDMGKPICTPSPLRGNQYTSDDELLYSYPTDLATFNPYEHPGPYRDTNLMYTRGVVQVTRDGRRRISYGRGFTFYDLPEPHYNTSTLIQNVMEKREQGLYEYAPDDFEDDTGNCKVCSIPTPYRCQKCSAAFYCGRNCQVIDWPKHKTECQEIPKLVKKLDITSIKSQIGNGHLSSTSQDNSISPPMRRPNTITTQSTDQQPKQAISSQETIKTIPQRDRSPPRPIRIISNQRSENKILQNPTSIGNFKAVATSFSAKQQQQKINSNQHKGSLQTNEDELVFQKHTFLPKDKFEMVMVTMVEDVGCYWIQKVSDCEALQKLVLKLEEYAKTQSLMEPEEGVKCIIDNGGIWCRATIEKLTDKKSLVFFHDWGTRDEIQVSKVVSINGFEKVPFYARQIRLVEDVDPCLKSLNTDDQLDVKAVMVEEDGIIITQGRPIIRQEPPASASTSSVPLMSSLSVPSALSSFQNILDELREGQQGIIILHAELSKNEFNGTLVPENKMDDFDSLIDRLKCACNEQVKNKAIYIPKVGDLCCGKSATGDWYRGVIIAVSPSVKIAVIDESRVFTAVQCTYLPPGYNEICSLGVICKFPADFKFPNDARVESALFIVNEMNEAKDSGILLLSSDDLAFESKVQIRKWIPRSEQKGIQRAQLISGNEVIITHFYSQNLLYVYSLEKEEFERCTRLEQEIAKCALNKQKLTENPVIGEMVMAQFIDGNFYRAIVIKVDGRAVSLKYVDYGNEEISSLDKIFKLPNELKEDDSRVTTIKLKGVPTDTPLTQEATAYFEELIGMEVPLVCTFEGNPLNDGVILTTPKSQNVNDTLKDLLKPTWQKDNPTDEKKVFEIGDLPFLKLGEVGDEIKAVVLQYYEDQGTLILGPNDEVAVEAIQIELTERIQQYVKTTKSHYIPRDNELCIAAYEGVYYRALCLEFSASPNESRVYFIDFGNTERVKHVDIRLMTEDFMQIGAYGTLCNITPATVPKNKFNDKVTKRISELLPIMEMITIKIVSLEDDDSPNIDIPGVRTKLAEEGLI